MEQRIIKGLENVEKDYMIFLCFTHAGAGASFYYRWKKPLQYLCKVCQVQLAGREDRADEEPYKDMFTPAEEIIEILMAYDNRLVLFGHSMGTKLLYEVEKGLEKRGRKSELVIVSACPPPHMKEKNPIGKLPEEEFIKELIKLNGIPKLMQENKEILNMFLPVLRADFLLSEGYVCKEKVELKSPIKVMGGLEDSEATQSELLLWSEYGRDDFSFRIFEGDHFYIREHEKEVLKQIEKFILETERKNGKLSA